MNLEMFSQIAQVNDHLYLSSAAAVKPERIRQLGITSIINATLEIPNLNLPNLECIQIHIDDSPSARLCLYFDRCSDKINQVNGRGGKTLVHCIAGVSRSASLCIAYLMKYQRMTLEQAYRFVKRKRPVIHPNSGFWRQLIDYERTIYGRNTVKMVQTNVGPMPDVYFEESSNSSASSYLPSRNHISGLGTTLGRSSGTSYSRSLGSTYGNSLNSGLGSSLSTRLSRTTPSWYNGFSSY